MSKVSILHCMNPGVDDPYSLYTVCGLEYGQETLAHWPVNFKEFPEHNAKRCEDCLNHPDLPLLILGDLP